MTRLVLIGDSIRRHYQAEVMRRLMDQGFDVRGPDENCGTSRDILQNLNRWVFDHDPDIVHINCGLHDLRIDPESNTPQVSLDDYRQNIEQILRAMIKCDVRVIWATCTPVDELRHNACRFSRRYEQDVLAYNSVAIEIATRLGVQINNLFEAINDSGRESLLSADGVHFTEAGYDFLAEQVAGAVRASVGS